ncbi:hypothetical protein [Actinospica robiniae]|uniref:hypothetical protein n=1 Tax=Actinospica robiniae TaxID=304901 RepID=UPI000424D279|nr:hypothetical protein [Actinospica robiniae]
MTTKSDTPTAGESARSTRAARIGLLVLCLLAGLAVGVVGSFLHRAQFGGTNGDGGFPDGLLLSLGGLAGLLLGLTGLTRPVPAATSGLPGRLAALGAAAGGWVIAVIWLTYVGPPTSFQAKGDVILANDWISMTFLIVGLAGATAFLYKAWIATLEAKMAKYRGPDGKSRP